MRLRVLAIAVALLSAGPCLAEVAEPERSLADPQRFVTRDGALLYQAACQACHMQDGSGGVGAGAYPALANNPKLQASAYPVYMVLQGRKAMPAFGAMLDDEQVARVVAYIRSSFGNDYSDDVAPALVDAIRQSNRAQ